MAVLNEIQHGRYNRFFQKFLSLKGRANVNQVVPEIAGTWNLFHGVENRYLEAWDLFGYTTSITGAAGVAPAVRLRNAAGSNLIAVFTKLLVFEGGGDAGLKIQLAATTADLNTASVGAANPFDLRGRTNASLIASTQVSAAPPALANILNPSAISNGTNVEIILFEDQEIPLLPGSALQVAGSVAAASLTVSAFWRERFLEESERA